MERTSAGGGAAGKQLKKFGDRPVGELGRRPSGQPESAQPREQSFPGLKILNTVEVDSWIQGVPPAGQNQLVTTPLPAGGWPVPTAGGIPWNWKISAKTGFFPAKPRAQVVRWRPVYFN